jgi:hypothetical protein
MAEIVDWIGGESLTKGVVVKTLRVRERQFFE